ncbi:aquaporin AQPAn.G isoform X1 [Nasonia vitripennis]|uniref:Aquaporin AQPAn.G n=1 Tax=Nasonia vitripennis TaxID=7425 RepID=A0A7M7QJE0_NASVI|nr:aquaporin AQPAn.G isoform X1 [Nasonia vitripennis]XP_031787721.1 aquaporin AQPAn.G isoform X1 [Nasonia vitripennis]XP_032457067.1 aquaporin AQPAn.G isoform X1 [Nasonia vitripennis]
MASLRNILGAQELTDKKSNLYRALVAEFLGTMLLNFFGCGSAITGDTLAISFSFGLTVAAVIQAIGHVSGGHVNPAVTFGMLAIGKIPVIRGLLYVISQCCGAIAGSAVLRALTSPEKEMVLGAVALKNGTDGAKGMGVEFFLAFILVLVVCGACDPGKPEAKPLAPLIIGLAVTVGHIVGIERTSTGMNPARALGSAVVVGEFPDHWLYWVGPILGGAAGALIYTHVIGAAKEPELPRSYTTVATEEKERFEYIDSGRGGL